MDIAGRQLTKTELDKAATKIEIAKVMEEAMNQGILSYVECIGMLTLIAHEITLEAHAFAERTANGGESRQH